VAGLTGAKPSASYQSLLRVNDNTGIDSSLEVVEDGAGNDSVLQLSTTAVNITGAGTLQYAGTAITATASEINSNCDVLTEAVTTTNVIAASETGTHFVLNSATAFVSTLPAAAAGLEFWFHAGATQVTGGNHTIVTDSSANVIEGSLSSREDAAGVVACVAAADTISFIADKAVQGDLAHVWSDGTDWYLDGHCFVQDGMTTTQAS